MNLIFADKEKICAKLLLEEMDLWESNYKQKLKYNKPYLSQETVNNFAQCALSRKFKSKFNSLIKIKINRAVCPIISIEEEI